MQARTIIVGGALAVLLAAGEAQAITSNPTADFSITNGNPNGLWSYAQMDVGFTNYRLLSYPTTDAFGIFWDARIIPDGGPHDDGTPFIWKNMTSNTFRHLVGPGLLSLHPGPDTAPAVLRWTAPEGITGGTNIKGQFFYGDQGVMLVGIRDNNSWVWQASDQGSFDLNLSLSPGDTIDFVVYGAYTYGNTPLDAQITYNSAPSTVPEPLTVLSAFLGVAALGGYVRRRLRNPPTGVA